MNRDSSLYTILYASVMVILVAVGLSFTHQVLSDRQIANENIDKMQQILRSLRINASPKEAEAKYAELIKDAYLIKADGTKVQGSEGLLPTDAAFRTDIAKSGEDELPVFVANVEGKVVYVIPMTGKGLWGGIWGYMSVSDNGSTVYGTDFGHDSETPGLGAEIVYQSFRNQFEGKDLLKNNDFKSIAVVKPGHSVADRDYVDGVSGGTITSKGVNDMLLESVGKYKGFLLKLNADAGN